MSAIADEPVAPFVARGFDRVADVFADCLSDRPDCGAAVCVYVDGRPVVDLWGGPSYRLDSVQLLYSATKGALAVCLGVLIERGLLDVEAPMSRYWPEFAQAGKADITVATVMSHQAGLPGVEGGFTLAEALAHEGLASRLAAQAPYWKPGAAVGYHGVTIGTLGRELVRRVAGVDTGELFRQAVAEPLLLDFWIGLPEEELHRVARVRAARRPAVRPEVAAIAAQPESLLSMSLPRGLDLTELDAPEVWGTDLPSVTGVADARSLARMYAACIGPVDCVQLFSPDTLRILTERRGVGVDVVNVEPVEFGLSFQLPFPRLPYAGAGSFGHDGHNGTLGLASPSERFAFGFTTDRQPDYGGADPYALRLVDAVRECL